MIRSVRILPLLLAGALGFGLVGCGVKGGLEPPPSAATDQPPGTAATNEAPRVDPDGKPIAPPGPKKHLPIDWILD